jgi:hypothetical protein
MFLFCPVLIKCRRAFMAAPNNTMRAKMQYTKVVRGSELEAQAANAAATLITSGAVFPIPSK